MAETVPCQICLNTETSLIQNTGVFLESSEIDIVKCNQCELIFLNPQPTLDEIEKIYSDDYFLQWYTSEKKREFSKNFFRNLFYKNNLLYSISQKMNKPDCRILDIGCGMGFFLEVAREWRCKVFGVEISRYATKHCRENLNLDVHHGTLETADFPIEYFDVITAFDVIEHLKKLSDFLSLVNKILKKDGVFIILVPNYDSIVFQLDRIIHGIKKTSLPNVPEHLTYFTMDSLKRLLQKHGFRVKYISSTDANDEYERLKIRGSLSAIIRSILDNLCYFLGRISNRKDTILAVAKKSDGGINDLDKI